MNYVSNNTNLSVNLEKNSNNVNIVASAEDGNVLSKMLATGTKCTYGDTRDVNTTDVGGNKIRNCVNNVSANINDKSSNVNNNSIMVVSKAMNRNSRSIYSKIHLKQN